MNTFYHMFYIGLLLGLGAAMPIGPVNLEIIRRNVQYGLWAGLLLGMGAVLSDLTYIIALSYSFIALLQNPHTLHIIGVLGSMIIGYFGIQSILSKPRDNKPTTSNKAAPHHLFHLLAGYSMTLINPYTILFWGSISSQIVLIERQSPHLFYVTIVGVIAGAAGWAVSLNLLLHATRERINANTMSWLNKVGGVILILFSLYGLYHNTFSLIN